MTTSGSDTARLRESMRAEVEKRKESLLAEARAEAACIVEEGRQAAEERREAVLRDVRAELDNLYRRSQARLKAETEKAELAVKDTVTEDVLAKVRERIAALAREDRFGDILEALLKEVIEASPPGVKILAPEAHVDRCREWLEANGHEGFEVEGAPWLRDGVAAEDPKRSFRLSNTLHGRLEKLEPLARKRTMERLFKEQTAG